MPVPFMCEANGIEDAAPGFVGPAGDADAYLARQGCRPSFRLG